MEARRAWAPHGVDRFHELVRMGYFTEGRFFRVLPGFIAQFGVHRDFDVHAMWSKLFIVDDPPQLKNLRGTLAFAKAGPNTRATEIFINLADNAALDDYFVPFAKIVQGMDVVDRFFAGYGEMRPEGKCIDRARGEGDQRVSGAAFSEAGLHQAGDDSERRLEAGLLIGERAFFLGFSADALGVMDQILVAFHAGELHQLHVLIGMPPELPGDLPGLRVDGGIVHHSLIVDVVGIDRSDALHHVDRLGGEIARHVDQVLPF